MAKQIEEMNKEELINFINSENEKIESANIEIQKYLKKIGRRKLYILIFWKVKIK